MSEDVQQRRVEVIKLLRQGEGMTIERIKTVLDDDQRKAITSADKSEPEEVFNLIRWSALSMLDDQYSAAIKNALGIGEGIAEGNLTERRMNLLERSDIKLRTLINHEDTGAELLAQQIDITRKVRQDLGTVDVMDVAASIERLTARLDRAEQTNRRLNFAVFYLFDKLGLPAETFLETLLNADLVSPALATNNREELVELVDSTRQARSDADLHRLYMDTVVSPEAALPERESDMDEITEIVEILLRLTDETNDAFTDDDEAGLNDIGYRRNVRGQIGKLKARVARLER